MNLKQVMRQHATQSLKSRDWYSAEGTGWGEKHDQPNPFAKAMRRLRQDASETLSDLRDEPGEVPYRLRRRLDDYIKGQNPY